MFVKTLIASLCVIGVALAEQTPVFLWNANSVAQPALQTVSQSDFAAVLSELLADHMVVAFQENGLTNKDFLCSNLDTAESCYAQLQGVSPKTYYTSVENPAEALRSVTVEREFNSIDEHGKLVDNIECKVGKAVFVTFDDTKLARESVLEAHDAAIAAVTKQLKCNVAYLYMAAPATTSNAPSALRRARRDALTPISETAAASGGYIFKEGNQFLIFFQSVKYVPPTGASTNISVTSMSITNVTANTQFSVTLHAANDITFDITYSKDGYYTMSNVKYNGITYRSQGINSLTTFAYFCGQLTLGGVATEDNPNVGQIVWQSLQFQAPFGQANFNQGFGDAWHCVGFFSPAILAGLFIVILMFVILFTGVCWMMDINTMDRFDDPKGKTITISAAE